MKPTYAVCDHTCKEFCTALDIATKQEKSAILQYGALRDECSYPDVKMLLNELILEHQKSINLLVEVKLRLENKFSVLDQVRESFDLA